MPWFPPSANVCWSGAASWNKRPWNSRARAKRSASWPFCWACSAEIKPNFRANAGALLKKINLHYLTELMRELQHPVRRHRLRAIRGTLAYGWHFQIFPSLLALINDEDTLIRRATIEVLGHIPAPESIAALVALKDDSSQRVRETVELVLANIAPRNCSMCPWNPRVRPSPDDSRCSLKSTSLANSGSSG